MRPALLSGRIFGPARFEALGPMRHEARARALEFGWGRTAELFLHHLVPAAHRRGRGAG